MEVVAAVVILAAAIVPAVVGVVTRWGRAVTLVQDAALMDLRVRDVLSRDTPLVGVYSQFGWNHPGPVAFWLLAPFSWIAGGGGWGLLVGTALLQAVTIAAIGWIAWREAGPRWAALWGAITVLSYAATGPWMLVDVWNPHLAFPVFIFVLVTAWRAIERPWTYLVWCFGVSMVLVQLHVGYVPLVGGLLLAIAIRHAIAWHAGSRPERPRRLLGGVAVAIALLWVLPVVEASVHRGGNLRRLFDYFVLRAGAEPGAGRAALGAAATQFEFPPPWAGGRRGPDPLTGLVVPASAWWLVVPVVAALVGAACFRRSDVRARALLVVSWIAGATGFIALLSVRGKLAPYVFYWQIPVSILLLAATCAPLAGLLPERQRRVGTTVALSLVAVGTVLLSGRLVGEVVKSRSDTTPVQIATPDLVSQAMAAVPDGPLVIRWLGSPLGGLQAGLIDSLDRRGVDVRTDVGEGFQFGPGRETEPGDLSRVWYASEQGFVTGVLAAQPEAEVVAITTPLSAADDAELTELQRRAFDELAARKDTGTIAKLDSPLVIFDLERTGVLEPAARSRLSELNQIVQDSGRCRCAIVAFAPDDLPDDLLDRRLLDSARGAMP